MLCCPLDFKDPHFGSRFRDAKFVALKSCAHTGCKSSNADANVEQSFRRALELEAYALFHKTGDRPSVSTSPLKYYRFLPFVPVRAISLLPVREGLPRSVLRRVLPGIRDFAGFETTFTIDRRDFGILGTRWSGNKFAIDPAVAIHLIIGAVRE